jgi:hypothetical protein
MLSKTRFYNKSYFPEGNGYFPQLSGNSLLNRAVHEGCLITQAPTPLVYFTALGSASLALQGLIDVELPIKKICPVSIMGLTIAGSGERKSTVENLFTKGVKAFEKEKNESYKKEENKYLLKLELHKDRVTAIKRSLDLNDEEQYGLAYELLLVHKENIPTKPVRPKLMYEDATVEALLFGLYANLPNGFLGSSEGGNIFNGRAMQQTSVFNAIWSGDVVIVDRKSAKSFTLSGVRLTLHIMTQYSALDRYMKKTKDDTRGNGFLSRLLVCAPYSNCGGRQISEAEYSSENLDEYNNKVTEFLSASLELNNHSDRRVVRFSDEAKRIWIDIANDIESKMQPNATYCNAKDHASKLAENIARVAALIHYFEHPADEELSAGSLWEAINLVSYFSSHFMSVFSAPPKHVIDAQNLMQWLSEYANSGIRYLKRNNILQFGPAGTRKKKDLEAALEYLKPNNDLKEMVSRKTRVIDLWPQQPFDEIRLNQDLLQDVVF